MSMSTSTSGNGATPHAPVAEWQPESPFLPATTYEAAPASSSATAPSTAFGTWVSESPFHAEFDGESAVDDPRAEHVASLLGELYDREFEEALVDLVNEGAAVLAAREERESGDPARDHEMSERVLREFYAPLAREAHALLDRIDAEVGEVDLGTLTEAEVDARLEGFAPPPLPGTPEAFEQFLGKLVKKVKSAAKGAMKLAKRVGSVVGKVMPLSLVLGRLKPLVNPLIERVLRTALGRLPVALRPIAARLAQKLLGVGVKAGRNGAAAPAARTQSTARAPAGAGDAPAADVSADAGGDAASDTIADAAAANPAEIQSEFDSMFAGSLVAGEAFESEAGVRMLMTPGAPGPENALRELRYARRRFAERMVGMREGEDPAPEVENFVPAVLAAAKVGIGIIGRPKVVSFLAGLVAKLIAKYVGQQPAHALSRALVDTGLRLVSLEATEESERMAAGYTLASTVENTVNHLLESAPAEAWEDEVLLESYAQEAFEQAAAAAFPDAHIRHELREAGELPGAWVTLPGLAAYEKYSVVPQVTVTPQQARDVRTFGGDTLAAVLRARHGIAGHRPVTGRLHLYRALRGTTLADIARRERVRGLGSVRRAAWSAIHPLTRDAARTLLREPGLGREVDARYLVSRDEIAPLQRFYYLELPEGEARIAHDSTGARKPAGTSRVNLVLDLPRAELVLHAYLSEPDAQEIAARVRTGAGIRTLPGLLRPMLQDRLAVILSGARTRRVRIIHEAVPQEHALPTPAARLLGLVGRPLAALLVRWSMQALRRELEQRLDRLRAEFVKAADEPVDGLTLTLRFRQPGFFPALRRVLASPVGALATLPSLLTQRGFDGAEVTVRPGRAV